MAEDVYEITVTWHNDRKWGWRRSWLGWRRVFGLALVLNVMAPAASVVIAGWHLHFGRIPRQNRKLVRSHATKAGGRH